MQRQIFNILQNCQSKEKAEKILLSLASTLEYTQATDLHSQELFNDIFEAIKIFEKSKTFNEAMFKINNYN
jgi:hypothetical protein